MKKSTLRQLTRSKEVLDSVTVRDFSGGLNVVDNQLNLKSKYATVLSNIHRAIDGTMAVRQGTKLFIDINDIPWWDTGNLVPVVGAYSQTGDPAGTVTNPTAWHDGNETQTLANSTYQQLNSNVDSDPWIQLTTTFSDTPLKGGIVFAPSDGWLQGDNQSNSSDLTVTIEMQAAGDTSWTLMSSRTYDFLEYPDSVSYTTKQGDAAFFTGIRFTIAAYKDRKQHQLRVGTAEAYGFTFVASPDVPSRIIGIAYYNNTLVVVTRFGTIASVTDVGEGEVIWNSTIAGTLPGSPPGWVGSDVANFTIWNGKLIVVNGVDQPIIIDYTAATPVSYLVDLATGSNAFVPVCKYITVHDSYVIMTGDPSAPDKLHISSSGTSGTWKGEADPNDGVDYLMGKFVNSEDDIITGVSVYREFLLITFSDAVILARLGIYDDAGNHTPDFGDVIHNVGALSHESTIRLGSDTLMLDAFGVHSLVKAKVSNDVIPETVSELITPLFSSVTRRLPIDFTQQEVWAVHNRIDNQVMFFLPNHSGSVYGMQGMEGARYRITPTALMHKAGTNNEVEVSAEAHPMHIGDQFVLRDVDGLAINGFSTFTQTQLSEIQTVTSVATANTFVFYVTGAENNTPPPSDAHSNQLNMIYLPLFTETLVAVYNRNRDKKLRNWAVYRGWKFGCGVSTPTGRTFLCSDYRVFLMGNTHRPYLQDFIDTEMESNIPWDWELPWSDFNTRFDSKRTRHLQIDTQGDDEFTAELFTDNIYQDDAKDQFLPVLSATFEGRDAYKPVSPNPDGLRLTSSERLVAWPTKGKLFKLRFHGTSSKGLRFVSIVLSFLRGNI